MEAVLEDPVHPGRETRRSARSRDPPWPVLEQVIQAGRPLLVVAEGRRGRSARDDRRQQACAAPSPRFAVKGRRVFGDRRKRMPRGHCDPHRRRGDHRGDGPSSLENTKLSQLGRGPPRRDHEGRHHDHRRQRRCGTASRPRIKQLKAEIEEHRLRLRTARKLQERLAKLRGRRCRRQGRRLPPKTEMKEKKHRVEDALQATPSGPRKRGNRCRGGGRRA